MASIVGHTFAGVIAKKFINTRMPLNKERGLTVLVIFLAILPDFDIIIYILFKPLDMIPHRGFSHGLLFILVTASILTLLTEPYFKISKLNLFSICFLALFSHLILDYLMGSGPPVPFFPLA